MSKRSSGLDFSDRLPALDQHPDMDQYKPQTSTLQRNKTERGRLQGLQRSNTSSAKKPSGPKSFPERVSLWMINEGQRHLFFATFLFLHLIVSVLGFMHYGLKDNLTNARHTFGITFSEPIYLFYFSIFKLVS
jgi:NADPH oxidase